MSDITKTISDGKLAELLRSTPAPRVTKQQIEARIVARQFRRINDTITHCIIVLDNGFSATGEAACVNPENYDKEIGERIAYDDAFRKLWRPFGFMLAEDRFRAQKEEG